MNAAELLVKCLEDEGVSHVFGVAGEEIMSVLDALADSSITYVSTRHEQGAALMADVYGRLTGKPGVCLATLGPGATNLMTGVADAFLDHAPVVAITGQIPLERVHKESHQYIDTMGMFEPLVKWQARVGSPDVIPEVVRKAFKLAATEKPGPTHIELPESVAGTEAVGAPLAKTPITYPHAERKFVSRAADIITEAQRPMILAGNGVIRRRASEDLRAFATKTGIPVANTFMSKGVMGYTHPLARLTVGLQNLDYAMCGLADADVVIAIGYDMVEVAPRLWNPAKDKRIVHIDTLPAEVDEHYLPDVELVSEIGTVLRDLTEICPNRAAPADHTQLKETVLGELARWADDESMPMKPQRILSDMRRTLGPSDLLISDVGAHKLWIARMFPASEPNSVIVSNGFATMGIGVPGGIAAKLAQPERRVLVATGDGGFLMNVQELETARRLATAFVTLVWVDDGYGVIRWKQEKGFGRSFGVEFGNPDFVALANAFGLRGYAVQQAGDLAPILEEALSLNGPSVVAVPVDYSENRRLTEALGEVEVTL